MIDLALTMLGVYLLLGLIASVWLLAVGLPRLDPDLVASPRRVRVLLLPGCVGLWPLLLVKVSRLTKGASA